MYALNTVNLNRENTPPPAPSTETVIEACYKTLTVFLLVHSTDVDKKQQ